MKTIYKIFSIFFGINSALLLMLIFALSIAYATIIESQSSSTAAWVEIYSARWLEVVIFFLCISLLFCIVKFKMKFFTLIFHFSFLIIAIGAFITRYFGIEGTLHIRVGDSSDEILTNKYKLSLKVGNSILSDYINSYDNSKFKIQTNFDSKDVSLTLDEYFASAKVIYKPSKDGFKVITFAVSNSENSGQLDLIYGQSTDIDGIVFNFEDQKAYNGSSGNINLQIIDNQVFVVSDLTIEYILDNNRVRLKPFIQHKIEKNLLYSIGDINFALVSAYESAVMDIKRTINGDFEVIKGKLKYGDLESLVYIWLDGRENRFILSGHEFLINAYREKYKLPFRVYLDDFFLSRYPGSKSPSGYFSQVSILEENNTKVKSKIYPNHILDYAGYRFFQSSYDPDELGTVLSVNKDPGRIVTYFGYFLLCFGLVLNLITPNSRFHKLLRK